MEDAAKGSGLDEAAGSLRDMKNLTSKKALGLDALDRAAERFEKWDPKKPTPRTTAQPDPATPRAQTPTPQSAATPAAAEAPATSEPAAAPAGQRRLRAVRRSDMKDD